MKICLVSPLPPPLGGISVWSRSILDYLKRHDIICYQIDIAPRWRKIYIKNKLIRAVGGGIQFIHDLFSYLLALMKGVDIIHLTSSGHLSIVRDIFFCILAKVFNLPLVYHIHHGKIPEIVEKNGPEKYLLNIAIRLSKVTIVITKKSYYILKNKYPLFDIRFIPNPAFINKDGFTIGKESKKVLFLGWVIREKGIEELVKAWAMINKKDWTLNIAGPGDLNYIKNILFKMGANNIIYLGEVEHADAIKLIEECDFLVLPSYSEGFPMVILEAMSLAKPIIATKVGEIPNILGDNAGIIIPPRDIKALTEAILLLIENHNLRIETAKKAFERVKKRYSSDFIFEDYLTVWKECLGRRING